MTEQMSVNDNNVSEHTLNVGQHFNDYEQLSKTVNVFCKEHYHPFVIRTRSQKQVLYKCCHGIKQNSKCLGKRPNQHYYYKNCKAQINFYKSKNEKWKLTKLLLNHNHTVGKEEYSNYGKAKIMNENDYETATDLILSSAKDGMVNDEDTNDVDIDDIDKDEFGGRQKVLSDREKFNTALTVTKNIADILSNYGTTTFNKYMNELKLIEKNARNGVSLFENEYSDPKISSIEFETSNLVEAGSCQDSLVGTESQNESDTNHQSNENIKFKTKIKSKGRPKRKTKQIQFYKKQTKTLNKK